MSEIIDWLITTPLGLAAVIVGFLVLFTLIALISERKTRKLYPDRNRRGTKAVAKAKAKKKARAKTADKPQASKPKQKDENVEKDDNDVEDEEEED
jgi:predicted lipid-binding transport protein (Tim44 family)